MTARLRKVFHYPDDPDPDHTHEELDEQEQEQLIKRLQSQHDMGNAKYSIIFTVVPLLSATLFLRSIFSPSSSLYEWLASLTSIFSLAATAYGMNQRASLHQSRPGGMSVSGTDYIVIAKRWLLPVNAAFCVLLGLVYILVSFTEPLPNTRPVLYFVPGAMLVATLVTQRVMASVDPSLLENLRYEYKGP